MNRYVLLCLTTIGVLSCWAVVIPEVSLVEATSIPSEVAVQSALNRAAYFEERGYAEAALSILKEAAVAQSENYKAVCSLASLYFEKGNFEKAFELFKRAAGISSGGFLAKEGMARTVLKKHHPSKAMRYLASVMKIAPERYTTFLLFAQAAAEAGFFNKAEKAYKQAIALAPAASDAQIGLADLYLKRHEIRKARQLFEQVLARQPWNEQAKMGFRRASGMGLNLSYELYGSALVYSEHRGKESSRSFMSRLALSYENRITLAIAGRSVTVKGKEGHFDTIEQGEGYATLAFTYSRVALQGMAGRLSNTAAFDDRSSFWAAGVTWRGRWEPTLWLSQSKYDHFDVTQWYLKAPFRISSRWIITPRLLSTDTTYESDVSYQLELAWRTLSGKIHFAAGGKYGKEHYPLYPEQPTIYNFPDTIEMGGWGTLTVALFKHFSLFASYERMLLSSPQDTRGVRESALDIFTLGTVLMW